MDIYEPKSGAACKKDYFETYDFDGNTKQRLCKACPDGYETKVPSALRCHLKDTIQEGVSFETTAGPSMGDESTSHSTSLVTTPEETTALPGVSSMTAELTSTEMDHSTGTVAITQANQGFTETTQTWQPLGLDLTVYCIILSFIAFIIVVAIVAFGVHKLWKRKNPKPNPMQLMEMEQLNDPPGSEEHGNEEPNPTQLMELEHPNGPHESEENGDEDFSNQGGTIYV